MFGGFGAAMWWVVLTPGDVVSPVGWVLAYYFLVLGDFLGFSALCRVGIIYFVTAGVVGFGFGDVEDGCWLLG